MGLTATFSTPLYSGGSISSLVPAVWPIALNGRPYMIDTQPETYYVRWQQETIPLLRQQADQSKSPAEASINPEGFWRRAQDSWHHGAGQTYRDRDDDADPYRFRSSQGVDVWTRYQISLLHATDQKLSTSNTNVKVVAAGAYLYYADGSTVKRASTMTADSPTYTSIAYAGGTVSDICSDGANVYVTDGSNIYVSPTSGTTLTSTDTTDANICAYVKARFMCAKNNTLYNIPTLGSATNVMTFAHPNSGFVWKAFAEGPANIYAAGVAGDKSLIYRIAIKPDASGLDAPIVAGELPDGELVRSIVGYLGFMAIGTTSGFHLAEINGDGSLTLGPLIDLDVAVECFEPQDRFVWFGWSNYDTGVTGLGRMDLSQFTTDALVPAYASDLMAAATGAVTSVVTFGDVRYFTVSASGIWGEDSVLVTEGEVWSGLIGFGIPDSKTAVQVKVDTTTMTNAGEYDVYLAADNEAGVLVGTRASDSQTNLFPTSNTQAERFEVGLVLNTVSTYSPTILRWTLKAIPSTSDGPSELFHIPLLLYPTVETRGGTYPVDVEFERALLSDLRATRQVITYQEFDTLYTGFISDLKWFPYGLTEEQATGAYGVKGTMLVDFQRIG